MRAIAFFMLTLLGSAALAAPTDRPDGSFLRPYTNLWSVTLRSKKTGRTKTIGTWSDQGVFVSYKGVAAFKRVQAFTVQPSGAKNTTVNIMNRVTMAPLERDFSSSAGDHIQLVFSGTSVLVHDATGKNRAKPIVRRVVEKQSFYDFSGGTYGLLLVGYPLAARYSSQILTIAESDQSLHVVPFKVLGRETIGAKPGTRVAAWKVRAIWREPQPNVDGSILTFWLTREAPYVIKLVYDSPKQGVEYTYTMM